MEDAFVELQGGTLNLRVMTLPKSADRRYLGFLFLNPGTSLRFTNGDRLKINFEPDVDARDEDWSAFVVDPVHWAPLNSATILLTRPFGKDDHGRGTWREGTPFETADFTVMRNDTQARQTLAQASCVEVMVRVITSNQVFRNCLTAIQKIDQEGTSELKSWFLGSRMDEFPPINFYETLRAKFGDDLETKLLNLHGAQLDAVLGLKSLRYGKQLIQGPPGTGKTHYAREITKPFLIDDSQVHPGIMCSITNESVDELAFGMQQLVEEVTPDGQTKPMVIRYHGLSTEEDVGLLDAKKARGPPGTDKTHYTKEITKPFLLDDSKVHQGIMCSTTNEGVDELALGMQQLVEEVTPEGQTKPMAIRFHSLPTKEDVGLLDAKKARGKPADARPSIVA